MARYPLLPALLLSLAPSAAGADALDLGEIIVSGGLFPIAENAYGRAYTVISGEELKKRGIATVQDALRALPGVAVSSAGASLTQVRIRGAEANHTLVLIDGVEAQGGGDEYYFSGLDTADIERIEVLRGPQSVYYGSNASAGVINIITKKAGEGVRYGGTLEAGNGWAASAYVSARGSRGGVSLGFSHRDDEGFDESGDGGEKDGSRRATLSLKADWQASENLRFSAELRRSREAFDYDREDYFATDAAGFVVDDPTQFGRRIETLGIIAADYTMRDGRLTHRLSLQDTVSEDRRVGAPDTRGETRALKYRASLSLDGQPVDEAAQVLSLLAEREEDRNDLAPTYRRARTSLALEYRGYFDFGLDVQAGLRRDWNRTFAHDTTWNVGLSYRVPDTGLRLHGSAGKGIVNPSYYELFADDAFTSGNPGLKPESNRSFDLGIEAAFLDGRGLVDITWFSETLQDEIVYRYGGAPDASGRATYVNLAGESPRQGIELAGRLQATDTLDLRLAYTWLDAKEPDGRVEVRRPRHELTLGATWQTFGGRGSVSADLRYVAGQYDDQYFTFPMQRVRLPDHATVDLAATYRISDTMELRGRVENLFDRDYSDVWGYAAPGRTAWIGIASSW